MNSLERVIAAVSGEQPDRIPFDLGSSLVTSITKNAYIALAKELGVDVGEVSMCDTIQQLPVFADSMAEALEVDVRGVIPNFGRKNPEITTTDGADTFVDEYGVLWERPADSLYYDVKDSPFSGEVTVADIENHPWPDPKDPALLDGLDIEAKRYHDAGYAVILDSLCAGLFEMACRLRGYENFYMDLAGEPDVAHAMLDKLVEIKIGFYEAAAPRLGQYIQFVREGDDMAGQESLLMSPNMYRTFMMPRHKQLFGAQKRLFPQPFFSFFHSDGAIWDLIPTFIENGVEVLNPVQLTARGMDGGKLKTEFGRDIAFWGGGVNTQHVLPHATPEEVEQNVRERIGMLAGGGGYVFGTVHNIQDDVSPASVMAMMKAFRELREY